MPNNVATPVAKRRKVPKKIRKPQILALQAAGLTQSEVAKQMGVSRQSITRDMRDLGPSKAQTLAILDQAQLRLREVLPVDKRIDAYVECLNIAKATKQPSAGAVILTRLDDIDGLVPDVVRLRAKTQSESAVQPMFVLPAGAEISVTVGPAKPQDVVDTVIAKARNVTPAE